MYGATVTSQPVTIRPPAASRSAAIALVTAR